MVHDRQVPFEIFGNQLFTFTTSALNTPARRA